MQEGDRRPQDQIQYEVNSQQSVARPPQVQSPQKEAEFSAEKVCGVFVFGWAALV